jgi:hypothetical protein
MPQRITQPSVTPSGLQSLTESKPRHKLVDTSTDLAQCDYQPSPQATTVSMTLRTFNKLCDLQRLPEPPQSDDSTAHLTQCDSQLSQRHNQRRCLNGHLTQCDSHLTNEPQQSRCLNGHLTPRDSQLTSRATPKLMPQRITQPSVTPSGLQSLTESKPWHKLVDTSTDLAQCDYQPSPPSHNSVNDSPDIQQAV